MNPKTKNILSKVLTVAFIIGLAYFLNKTGLLQKVLDWMGKFGPWAPVIFVAVYVLTAVFFVPSFVFTFSSGALFGLWKGALLSLLGGGLGAAASLLIGRYLARDTVAKRFANNEKFKLMDAAVRKKGWKLVFLARLSPIFPFSVANYAFGLTSLSAKDYFLASVLGTIPSATVYTYMGTVTGSLAAVGAQGRDRTPAEWALLIVGLIATIALSVYIKRVATDALKENLN